jgi:hypothetical protein
LVGQTVADKFFLDGVTLENSSDTVSQKSVNQRKLIPLNIPEERKPQLHSGTA